MTGDLQFPKVFTNNYFGSDENNLDEYDNIDCELLLEFFGGESAGGQRLGYDSSLYSKQSSTFPAQADDVPSPSLPNEQSSVIRNEGQNSESIKVSSEYALSKKEELMGAAPKAKKQKVSDGQQNSRQSFPTHQNQEHLILDKGEHSQPGKASANSKNSTSKIVQLEASKDRRRLAPSTSFYSPSMAET